MGRGNKEAELRSCGAAKICGCHVKEAGCYIKHKQQRGYGAAACFCLRV